MASHDKELADQLESIRDDIAALTSTVSRLVTDSASIQQSLKRKVGNAARQATMAGEHMVEEAVHIGEEALHTASRSANAAVHQVEAKIERNPLTSVLVALGFGLLLGMFSRK